MGLRELLILVLILAIVGVILRGLYVALRARRGQLRMALEKNIPNYDPDELSLSELPNGGARMVERSFAEVVRQNSEFSARDRAARNKQHEHAIPVLMDSMTDSDDDEPAPERSSSVANARQAARQKHLLGRRQPQPQKPTHRPIDRMKTQNATAATGAAAGSAASRREESQQDPVDAFDDNDFDNNVIHDPLHDDGADASTLIDSRIDDPADDIRDDALDNTFDEFMEDAIEDVSDQPLYQRFEHDEEPLEDDYAFEEDTDEDLADEEENDEVLNPPPYAQEAALDDPDDFDEEIDSEQDVGYADDDLDDDFDEKFDEQFDEELDEELEDDEEDQDDDDDLDDFEDDDQEDDFDERDEDDEEEDDFDDDDDEDLDDEDDHFDEGLGGDNSYHYARGSEEYIDPLGVDLTHYDDDYAAAREQGEAPRSWWQKVGGKFGFGGRNKDADEDDRHAAVRERAEPVIGDSTFDSLIESVAPAASAAVSETVSERRHKRRHHHHDRDLDPRRRQEREQARAREHAQQEQAREQESQFQQSRSQQPRQQQPASRDRDARGYSIRQEELDLDTPDLWQDEESYASSDGQGYAEERQDTLQFEEPLDEELYYREEQQEAQQEGQQSEESELQQEWEPEPEPESEPKPKPKSEKEQSSMPDYNEVLVINVMAKPEREFAGVDVLQALLATGLRFGDMNIFHRHLDGRTSSPVVFSLANMVNPGTFDLNQISEFSTRGVCFFMTLPNVVTSMQAFDLMLDVAQRVRIALDGDLKDDNRSVMTAQTIEHYRQRVRDFDLRQLRQQK